MKPLVFTWPHALIFWAIFVWAFAPEFRVVSQARKRVAEGGGAKDSGSLQVILMGTWIAMMLAFPLAFVRALRVPARLNLPAFVAGTLMLVLGSLLRRHCFRMLDQYFTGDVDARADQPVIDRGAYRWVRHPSYTAGIAMFTGIGLALGSWASFAILLVITIVIYSYRVKVEERALVETLGDKYIAFMKTRKRFIPFIV